MSTFLQSMYFGFTQWRVILLVVLIQFLLAGIWGLQFYTLLQNTLGKTLELPKLLLQFDYTVVIDFLKEHRSPFNDLMVQLPGLLMVWVVLSTFLNAGLIGITQKSHGVSIREFLSIAISYYFPFLKINLCFLTMALIALLALYFPFFVKLEWMLNYFDTEKYVVFILLSVTFLFAFIMVLLYIWSITSRVAIMEYHFKTLQALKFGWKKLKENKYYIFIVLLIFLSVQFSLFCLIEQIKNEVSLQVATGLIVLFFIQQLSLYLRVMLRLMVFFCMKLIISNKPE